MKQSVNRTIGKREISQVNDQCSSGNSLQPQALDAWEIENFDLDKCVDETFSRDPRTARQLSAALGKSPGYLSRWRNNIARRQLEELILLCRETGQIGLAQKFFYEVTGEMPRLPRQPRSIYRGRGNA